MGAVSAALTFCVGKYVLTPKNAKRAAKDANSQENKDGMPRSFHWY